MNQYRKTLRDYGQTPVSVFPSLKAKQNKDMSFEEKIREIKKVMSNPDVVTFNEFVEIGNENESIIDKIRRSNCPDVVSELKNFDIPCGCITAVVRSRSRLTLLRDRIRRYNSMIVVNLDDLEDPEETKSELATLPYVFYAALSLCGKGLFALIPTAARSINEHQMYYEALREDLLRHGIVIDDSGLDVCCLRLATYDKNAYRNDNCTPFTLDSARKIRNTGEEMNRMFHYRNFVSLS